VKRSRAGTDLEVELFRRLLKPDRRAVNEEKERLLGFLSA
jgi:hypothetical protein